MTDRSEHETIALPAPRDNISVTIAHRLEYGLALTIGLFLRLIGVDAASAIAGGVTRLVGPQIRPLVRRAERNLDIAFPELGADERKAIIRAVFENLGRTAAEFAHLTAFDPDAEDSRLEIVGREKLSKIVRDRRPAIFISGHFANWEIMPIAIEALCVDHAFVYRPANNPLIDALIIRERARAMSRRQIPKGRRGGRDLIDTLRSGLSLALLVDQKLNSGGIAAPFFGKDAMTAPAPARLSLKFNAPLVPVEVERLSGARFRVTIGDPLAFAPSGDASADTLALTTMINEEIEKMARKRPRDWLWLHRRWPKPEYE